MMQLYFFGMLFLFLQTLIFVDTKKERVHKDITPVGL